MLPDHRTSYDTRDYVNKETKRNVNNDYSAKPYPKRRENKTNDIHYFPLINYRPGHLNTRYELIPACPVADTPKDSPGYVGITMRGLEH